MTAVPTPLEFFTARAWSKTVSRPGWKSPDSTYVVGCLTSPDPDLPDGQWVVERHPSSQPPITIKVGAWPVVHAYILSLS
jgi:hypothetical protein